MHSNLQQNQDGFERTLSYLTLRFHNLDIQLSSYCTIPRDDVISEFRNKFRAKKMFPSVTRRCRILLDEICIVNISATLRATDLRFQLP
jgi:hypothetical protein